MAVRQANNDKTYNLYDSLQLAYVHVQGQVRLIPRCLAQICRVVHLYAAFREVPSLVFSLYTVLTYRLP